MCDLQSRSAQYLWDTEVVIRCREGRSYLGHAIEVRVTYLSPARSRVTAESSQLFGNHTITNAEARQKQE